MNTYLVIFDLGNYIMTYSKEKGESVELSDDYVEYSFLRADYLKEFVDSSHLESGMRIHNQKVIEIFLNEYVSNLNTVLESYKGKLVSLFPNSFVINYPGSKDELLKILSETQFLFYNVFISEIKDFATNLNKKKVMAVHYLLEQSEKMNKKKYPGRNPSLFEKK